MVGRDQRVDGQQAERGRAVDEDQVVAAPYVSQRTPERQLSAHLAGENQLGLGEPEVGGQDVVVDRVARGGLAAQHVGDRRRRVRGHVEVVGEVALGIEIDAQHLEPRTPEGVGQRANGRRLARPALLG